MVENQNVNVGETASSYNISKFVSVRKLYEENKENGYEDVVKAILDQNDGDVDLDGIIKRERPKYAVGSLDEDGLPTQEKVKKALRNVLDGRYWVNVFEGGVRGGKDVWGIYIYTEYLMHCTSKKHLVLGVSLEHALLTVLQSNGFGLMYTIPHGQFLRTTEDGAQRGVFKFKDSYGVDKEVHFYGNYKQDDYKKFQGFTFGSVYLNEGTNQHLNGINEAIQRTSAQKDRLLLITQNPVGKANRFYTEFEKPFILNQNQVSEILDIQKNPYIVKKYNEYAKFVKEEEHEAINLLKKEFLAQNGVPNYKYLKESAQIYLQREIISLKYYYEDRMNNLTVQSMTTIPENHFLYDKSLRKVMLYEVGDENGNGIMNGYDYSYTHFTIEDNSAMSRMQRNDFKSKYAKGTSRYAQRIEGLRKSVDGAVFGMFTEDNLIRGSIHDFDTTNTTRIIAIDKGLNHPNGMLDAEINFENGTVSVLQEDLLDWSRMEKQENKGLESIYENLMIMIRSRRGRSMPSSIIVDPSAVELKKYLEAKGLPIQDANNSVWTPRAELKQEALKTNDKDLIGIDLLQTAIAKRKFMIHEDCLELRGQIETYEAPFDEKSGREKVRKVGDDLVDPARYLMNTFIRVSMWSFDESEGSDEREREMVSRDEREENGEWDLARTTARILYGEFESDEKAEEYEERERESSNYAIFSRFFS